MKNTPNLDEKWSEKTERFFDSLSKKKSSNPMVKTQRKIVDKDECK